VPDTKLYRKLKEIKPSSIAVIGDLILDQYLGGELTRISPEAPVGVLDCTFEELHLGGAANVASNLAKLGCSVSLVGVVGKDSAAADMKRLIRREKINGRGIITVSDRPTIQKTRLMAQGQQLMRVDREKRLPIPEQAEKRVVAFFEEKMKNFDGLVLSDYNKGLLTQRLTRKLIAVAKKNGKPVLIDPKGDSYAQYRGADVITPNRLELKKASGIECGDRKSVEKAARLLIKNHRFKAVLATLGADGMAWFPAGGAGTFFPTIAQEVFDVTGAGDTVVAVFAFGLLGGLEPEEAVRLSNHAGGLQVAHLGAVGIGLQEIMASLAGDGYAESKIVDAHEAAQTARRLKNQKKKVVFTNGCFDLIHYGHIQYLQKAKKLGDWLVLGLNSDASVKKLKGAGRPVLNENDRAHIMAALDCVDQVVLFGEPTPLKLIKSIKPDILVKGGDYTVSRIVGHKEVKKWGGKAVTIPYQEGKSTSGVIKQIVESRRR